MAYSKYFSTLALIFGIFATFQAQAQIGVGFRGGVLMSNQTAKQIASNSEFEIETENFTGYVVGIPVEFSLSKFFAFQAEVNYLKQGFGLAENTSVNLPSRKVIYDVIDIPVLAKIGWTGKKLTCAAVFGPSFQYIASGRVKFAEISSGSIQVEASENKIDFSQSIYEDFNRTNIFGQAGVQFGIPTAGGKFVFDGRYRFAISDQDSSDDFEVKGRGASATIGYIATFGKY
ncbi:MAG: outer membrane beta-barrel protein [Saprospiraceae bacterium]